MAYLPEYQYDLFISYAHVDNQSHVKGNDGWVDQFDRSLRICLSEAFGRNTSVGIWRDIRLPGNAILDPSIIQACRTSACLLCITSPGYVASEWCQNEYDTFCSANQAQHPPRHLNSSRIFNVTKSEVFSESDKAAYEERFGHLMNYKFYDADPDEDWSNPIWPKPSTDPDQRYEKLMRRLVRNIHSLLGSMKTATEQTAGIEQIEELPFTLDQLLLRANDQVIISANTIDRFSTDDRVRKALLSSLLKGVRVTLIMLNPKSASALAHAPFYQLESSGTAEAHYKTALRFAGALFELLDADSKARVEVLLSNYMPRFRAIVVDQKEVYIYLYMYGEDVSDFPDFVFDRNYSASPRREGTRHPVAARVIKSMNDLIKAPEIIPYIRDNTRYDYWERSKLAQWDRWTSEVKYRHRITHQYYVGHAQEFHEMFGHTPEPYVREHLDLLKGRTLVLGCGSGKEVEHLSRQKRCSELIGVDFSPEAIRLARTQCTNSMARFIMADFYDLEHIEEGQYDSIVANAAFVHLFEREDMSGMLDHIWKRLRPGGLCFIRNLYKELEGRPIDQDYDASLQRFKNPRWFVYYSRTYLATLASRTGFLIEDEATEAISKECGFTDLSIVMRKGFPHEEFDGVYWPTILLVKPSRYGQDHNSQ